MSSHNPSARDAQKNQKTQKKTTNGLVALSTVAVLTIYGSGYLKTRAAAERIAESGERRPAPDGAQAMASRIALDPASSASSASSDVSDGSRMGGAMSQSPDHDSARPTVSRSAADPANATAAAPAPEAAAPASRTSEATATSAAASMAGTSLAATTEPALTPAAAVASAPASAVSGSASAIAAPTPAPVAAESAVAAAPAAAPAPARSPYKDGTYTGWGTSRHGDIQASVTIQNGRIVAAGIAQCWTRYPCSWVDRLPPQVVTRQSAEVDYISGATQSTNAFYYGVVEALTKAKQ